MKKNDQWEEINGRTEAIHFIQGLWDQHKETILNVGLPVALAAAAIIINVVVPNHDPAN